MSKTRTILQVMQSRAMMEGAGVLIRRTIGSPKLDYFDPFLLFDEFKSDKADDYIEGFPDHPHRGFETVTYMLNGLMKHEDHKGNKGILSPGAVQWMTAGRGIVHSEMPLQKDGLMHGYQMWVNLPKKDKMIPPRYQDYQPESIPVVTLDNGTKIKIMAGESNGVKGAVNGISTAPLYIDITLPANTAFTHPVPETHNAFCYTVEGEGFFGPKNSEQKVGESVSILWKIDGSQIEVRSGEKPLRFLLAAAQPLNEPMARYGPFVMNTQQEIMQAFKDFQSGELQK